MTRLLVEGKEATLLDVLDRFLDKGVIVAGDLTFSVAEVDLIFASLRLVVTSVDKMWELGSSVSLPYGDGKSRGCSPETSRITGNNSLPGAGLPPTKETAGAAPVFLLQFLLIISLPEIKRNEPLIMKIQRSLLMGWPSWL